MKACLKLQPDVLFQRIPTNFKIKSTEWETYINLCTGFYIPPHIPFSVLDTKVRLGMVQLKYSFFWYGTFWYGIVKAFFFHTKFRFLWGSLTTPSFYAFSTPCDLLLPDKVCIFWVLNSWLSILQEFVFLTGQWFLPLSLAMLSMTTLNGFLCAFWRCKVHTSWTKKMKSSFPPCFLYNLCTANAHCITSLRKSFLYHLYEFLSPSKLSSCWSARSTPPILWFNK